MPTPFLSFASGQSYSHHQLLHKNNKSFAREYLTPIQDRPLKVADIIEFYQKLMFINNELLCDRATYLYFKDHKDKPEFLTVPKLKVIKEIYTDESAIWLPYIAKAFDLSEHAFDGFMRADSEIKVKSLGLISETIDEDGNLITDVLIEALDNYIAELKKASSTRI